MDINALHADYPSQREFLWLALPRTKNEGTTDYRAILADARKGTLAENDPRIGEVARAWGVETAHRFFGYSGPIYAD